MFESKKASLFETPVKKTESASSFVNAGLKNSARTLSGNGALKYSTTGNAGVDQFGIAGSYRQPRAFTDIAKDMEKLWAESPELAVRFTFYLRIITRQPQLIDGEKVEQIARGQGLKHESLMRLLWIYNRNQNVFWDNLPLFITVGSWRDVFELLRYDVQYHGWNERVLNWNKMFDIISFGIENDNTSNLVKKYLPQIKARSKCNTIETQANTIIGKWLCSKWRLTYKQYRQLKTSGTAHEWQKVISNRDWDKLDFGSIHGRALALLVSGKFLDNQKLNEKYVKWLMPQKTVKYTGYPHELMATVTATMKLPQRITVDKQFLGLVETGMKDIPDDESLIVVRDTSGSMKSTATGTTMSSYDIAKGLALYFSYFLKGKFSDSWIEFNKTAIMHKWIGNAPTDRWLNDHTEAVGNTNFQSVINLFCQILRDGVPESEFPAGILCVSDGEFDPAALGKTNVDTARDKLLRAGFSKEYVAKFKIILWNIPNSYYGINSGKKFETYGDVVQNVFYFSGYDASTVAF
ncbi:MAG: DUF2828 family protein [Richelia sp. SL_2_1]|nr:DUF2828 family protein [Richelia sp. SL_2_1]